MGPGISESSKVRLKHPRGPACKRRGLSQLEVGRTSIGVTASANLSSQAHPPRIVSESELGCLSRVAALLKLHGLGAFSLSLGKAGAGWCLCQQGWPLPGPKSLAHSCTNLCFLGGRCLRDSNLLYFSHAFLFPELCICPSSTVNIRFKAWPNTTSSRKLSILCPPLNVLHGSTPAPP